MADAAERQALEDEGRVFAAALGMPADDYVAARYAEAHRHLPLQPATPFDHQLMSLAAGGPWAMRAADAYARFFAPASALRRKLAVLVAILESAAPSDAAFASAEASSVAVLVQLVLTGTGFALLFGVGIAALAPVQLASRWQDDDA